MWLVEAWTWQIAFLNKITTDSTPDDLQEQNENGQEGNPVPDPANPNPRDDDQDQLNPDQGVPNQPNPTTRIEIDIERRFRSELEELKQSLWSIIE
jgi:hypothetical protein